MCYGEGDIEDEIDGRYWNVWYYVWDTAEIHILGRIRGTFILLLIISDQVHSIILCLTYRWTVACSGSRHFEHSLRNNNSLQAKRTEDGSPGIYIWLRHISDLTTCMQESSGAGKAWLS